MASLREAFVPRSQSEDGGTGESVDPLREGQLHALGYVGSIDTRAIRTDPKPASNRRSAEIVLSFFMNPDRSKNR